MSKLSHKVAKPTSIGGQALIEGVMMKGPKDVAIAVRTPDNQITVKKEPVTGIVEKYKLNKVPFLRGGIALIDSMILGVRSLNYAADIAMPEEETSEKSSKLEGFLERIFKDKLNDVLIYFSVFVALLISVVTFVLGPTLLTGALKNVITTTLGLNLIEGILRLSLFVGYIAIISKMEDIKRVFQYHGAEHKTIYCYENGEDLTVENVRKYSTLHPRCGTSFLFIVMMVSMIFFSIIGWSDPITRVVSRLILLPVVAGISYEIIRIAGKSQSALMSIVSYPGMMMQKLTTIEPDDGQIEVAIEALKNVLVEDEDAALW
ncbi:DUF1385 domain-containing protein [Alkaliphilus sp. MSJ-5]|uniref:DUF1385 domain-containing protein n=1 Tax=Alkaliphilus flagellatus TaxID=2841507 RepID=A0ABS6G350_9FIRM|nr:DUF1385 domain-containing protein [Alkaliphilus flagellatus]MBU5676571.1 DUF1385 domain-containing protein [Alkaliphilus flagellatus]